MDSPKPVVIYAAWPWCGTTETSLETLAKDICTLSDTDVIYMAPEEYTVNGGINFSIEKRKKFLYDVIDATTKRNVNISVVLGRHPNSFTIDCEHAFGSNCFHEIMQSLRNYVDVHFWQEFWFFKSALWYLQYRIPESAQHELNNEHLHCIKIHRGLLVPQRVLTPNITQVFCCLNRLPHPHRCRLIDELAKYPNVLDSNLVTWLMPNYENSHNPGMQDYASYSWKNWTEARIVKEEFNLDPHGSPDYCATNPQGYERALFDVVPESDGDIVFWTEKTVRSIVNFKPFLIVGGKHANHKLTDLGFQLYDEIFDYSFDEYGCYENRVISLSSGLADLTDKVKDPANAQMLNNMYVQVRDKTYHNFENLLRIMQQQDQIPFRSELRDVYTKYEDILHNNTNFVRNYFPNHLKAADDV